MTNTLHLGMPFIEGSQAQKHVTHNEALRILDAAIQIGVLDTDRTAPPSAPADGDRHIVASGATGAWAGQANAVAVREDGAWRFLTPKLGWCAWSDDDGVLLVYDGAAWIEASSGGGGGSMPDSVDLLGINDTASDPNLLTVRSNAALFNAIDVADGGTGDMRVQISKESSADTASVLFSEGFSGRAEFGLVGSNAFKLKVSNDGATFVEALSVDQASGNVSLPLSVSLTGVISPAQITANQNDYTPAGLSAASVLNLSSDASRTITGLAGGVEGRVVAILNVGSQPLVLQDENAASTAANRLTLGGDLTLTAKQGAILRYDGTASRWYALARSGSGGASQREVLTANRTYYVRTDGSNSNSGLSNTSGGAFLTVQKAWDTFLTVDLGGFAGTIQIGDGTYAAGLMIKSAPVGGAVTINGNSVTPTNVIISAAVPLAVAAPISLTIQNFRMTGTFAGIQMDHPGAMVTFGAGLSFAGTPSQAHIYLPTGKITCGNAITIASGSRAWLEVNNGANFEAFSATFTFSGTPAWSTGGILFSAGGSVSLFSVTMSGAATGVRYAGSLNATLKSFGAGSASTYFPGSSNGTTASGAQQG